MTQEVTIKEEEGLINYNELGIDARAGFEQVHSEQLRIPNVNLCQAMSDAVKDGHARPGDFWDNLQGKNLGRSVEVVLVGVEFGAAYFEVGEGLVCKSRNGETSIRGDVCAQCPYNQYWANFKKGNPAKCSRTANYLVLAKESILSGTPYPMLLTFSRMSFPAGQKLYSSAALSGKPIFAYSYNITPKEESGAKGKYFTMAAARVSPLNRQELVVASEFYKSFAKKWKESDTAIIGHEDVKVTEAPEVVDSI